MRDLLAIQDENFLDFASSLTDDEWSAPSLCAGWSNKDVLSHLALGLHVPNARMIAEIVRQRGSFDAANDTLTRQHASRHSPAELIDEFDRHRHRPRGLGRLLPARLLLGDHTVHYLDIALALGRSGTLAPRVANAVLTVETTIPNPFVPAKSRSNGLRLATTDTQWSRGAPGQPEIQGPACHLISTLAGRGQALNGLDGSGLSILSSRVSPSTGSKHTNRDAT